MAEPQHGPQQGWIAGLLNFAKGLTLANVLVIALLAAVIAPSYLIYRALNDPAMLNTFLSHYEVIELPDSPCALRIASVSGGGSTYAISTGFAFQGNDRWQMSVLMDSRPDPDEMESYCAALQLIVDRLHAP